MTPTDNITRKEVVLAGEPSKDFILKADCRILMPGTRVQMEAMDLPGESGGTYEWSTTSTKIRLVNTTGNKLVIEAANTVGTARDSETIVVTRTGQDGRKAKKSVSVTVSRVVFKQSKFQRFGYDDMDTPDTEDDHVSVASGEETYVHVDILGGAIASDFDFICDDRSVCEVPPPTTGAPSFELRIEGAKVTKAKTMLRARVRCPAKIVFGSIAIHVYAWSINKVVIGKFEDSNAPSTALQFPSADYTSHRDRANEIFKQAVVRVELENISGNRKLNAKIAQKNGEVLYDMASGGQELREALLSAFGDQDSDAYWVAIIRNMKSCYYLSKDAQAGSLVIEVAATRLLQSKMDLGTGPTKERITVECVEGNIGYLAEPLKNSHPKGTLLEFFAGAWSGGPIILAEGDFTEEELRWIILHELGHTALSLSDITDDTNIMLAHRGHKDYRLRYKPQKLNYVNKSSGPKCLTSVSQDSNQAERIEIQWDKIIRPEPDKET